MKKLFLILAFCTLHFALCTAEIKYIFYLIGDGMGSNQVLAAEMYQAELQGRIGRVPLCMTQFPYSGQVATFSRTNGITDSSGAGTCLATGIKTRNGVLGLSMEGDTLTSVAERLHAEGWGVGIMTTVAIDHATPAAFYANDSWRDNYYEIGRQLTLSGFDFFGGAGFHNPQGLHDDEAVNLYNMAEAHGYTIAGGYEAAKRQMTADKLIMVQSADVVDRRRHGSNLPYRIDRKEGDLSLSQIVSVAIPYLERKHKRFFMMIEGGMVDYAGHGDDGATAIGEVLDFEEALAEVYRFYQQHPDETLIVVTADHETGGMALGNSDHKLNLQVLQYQRCSSWILSDLMNQLWSDHTPAWQEVQALFTDKLGLYREVEVSDEEDARLREVYARTVAHRQEDTQTLYKSINALADAGVALLNRKARLGWTSHSHTGCAVPVFAIGVGAERFSGWHDNTEIVPLILQATETSKKKSHSRKK